MRRKTAFFGTLASIVALFCCVVPVSGSLVAYDQFNYTTSDGATLTGVTVNGGIGWAEPWQQGLTGVVGIYVGSPARSLSFSQTPALTIDGSNHVFAGANAANRRNLANPVAANTTYFSLLIRSFINESQAGGGARMRVEFFDGLNASGNMRANVGIDGTSLFVSGNTGGYSPSNGATADGVFSDETTYLLVMKRTGSTIFSALIEADDDLATLESEPDWQVSHGQVTGVNFNSLRIIIDGRDTALRADELRVATTWEGVVSGIATHSPTGAGFSRAFPEYTDTELVEAGLLEAVESEEKSEAMHWSHTVSQAGDYRLGMAWLEVLSGQWVRVSIRAGGETLREFAAIQGIEPVRLDQRFEGLEVGDTIEMTVTPEPGTTYRLGFHLACATPNFDGLDVFYVADFGAIGDGETDDMAAIHAAVAAARAAGGGIIRFEAGQTYRTIGLDDLTFERVFPLAGASNISIEGNGATLILHPPDGFAEVTNARNIQIDGFFIDYWPLPYFQGDIVAIDLDNRTIDLTVADRYPVPAVGTAPTGAGLPFFGRSFIPDNPGARSGKGHNIYVESIERVGGDRDVRIHVPEFAVGSDTPDVEMLPLLADAKNSGATEFVVPDLEYGHRNGSTNIRGSGRILFSNLRWYRVPHFWMVVIDNIGPVSFDNVNLQMKDPDTELLASWRDGFHIKNSRFGVTIDGSDMDGSAMYDDTFAIYTRAHRLLAAEGNRLELEPTFRGQKEIDTWRPGDWVSVWNSDQSELRGMGRLLEVEDAMGEDHFFLTLESLPEGLQADDILMNEEVLNRQTLIRNSSTTNVGTVHTTTRFRASDIHFEGNHFENFYFHVEFNMFWGTPRSRGIYVKDSYIDSPRPVDLISAIGVHFEDVQFNRVRIRGDRAQDVRLKDIHWTNVSGDIIDLRDQSTAWLYGDSTRNGSSDNLSSYTSVDSTSSLTFGQPLHGDDPLVALLAEAGEGKARLEWSAVENASSYTVYRSLNADGPFEQVVHSQPGGFVDGGLAPGATYYYAVTATDGEGVESGFSNIVSVQPIGTLLAPQADAYVQDGPILSGNSSNNFGTYIRLYVTNNGNFLYSTRHVYLRFDLSSLEGTVGSASLRLKVSSTGGSGDIHTLRAVADDSWGETSITWNNRPSTGSAIASAPSPGVGDWLVLDVTDQVIAERAGNQLFSSALISGGTSLVGYHSREASDPSDRPELLVAMRSAPIPSVPTGLSATEDEAGRIQLSWDSQGAPGEVSYRIYRATQPSGPFVQWMDTHETTFTDHDVVAGQSFFYWVAAVNSDGVASEPGIVASSDTTRVHEPFDYDDDTLLAGGTANLGTGWASGWQALSGGGLRVLNGRIDQADAAGSSRGIARPFSLNGPGRYYLAFYASAEAGATFSFRLKQALPGPYVRWAFSRNGDGSITIQGGDNTATSSPGVFAADKEYLVVSRFDTSGDIASVKLIDPDDVQGYLNEPAVWDLSASGATGVTINQLDVEADGGVRMDDIVIAESYAEVVLAVNLRAQDGLLVREPFNYTVGDRLDGVGSGTGWGTNKWTATVGDGPFIEAGSLPIPEGAGLFPGGNSIRSSTHSSSRQSVRLFETAINLGTTYYASFLMRRDEGGSFRIETSNASAQIRLGVGVDADGTLWTRRGVGAGLSKTAAGTVEEDTVYFVVVKQTGSTVQAALFEAGVDTVPEDESEMAWLTNSSAPSGIDQDRLIITIGGSAITVLDELRLGTTFGSVTSYSEPPIAPDIEHASIALDGGVVVVTVSFNENGNDTYTLQFSTNLVEGVWMDAVTGVTQSPVIFTNSTPAGFFRIRAQ